MRYFVFVLIVAIGSSGCENTEKKSRRFSAYYDIDSLIDSQLSLFSGMAVRINKVAELNQKKDSTTYETDSLRLAQELNAFRKANINKPANEGLYAGKVAVKDSLRLLEYLPVNDKENLEVQSVQLYFKGDQLVKIEAHVVEDHWLYNSDRILTLRLSEDPGRGYINHYKIKGSQKMIFRDRVTFTIEGSINPSALSSAR